MDVADRITELRKERGLSTNRLAKMAGIGQSTLREIEHRIKSPTVATIERICLALGITLADFFSPTAADDNEPLSPELRRLLGTGRKLNRHQVELMAQVAEEWAEANRYRLACNDIARETC